MSRFVISSDAQTYYDQTISRGAALVFLGIWERSSEAEAERRIHDVFYTAACANEIAEGRSASEERVLDVSEARLAIAALNVAADGDRLIASGEAQEALSNLQQTIGVMSQAPIFGQNHTDWLIQSHSSRAEGWRRISDDMARRETRGIYRMRELWDLDSREGLNPVDALFASFVLNYLSGGIDEGLSLSNIWSAGGTIERGLQGLREYYRNP